MDISSPYAIAMVVIFAIGYFMIAVEHLTKINKGAVALVLGILLWTILFVAPGKTIDVDNKMFVDSLGNLSQVVFFLMGALTIVEMISVHRGFRLISSFVNTRSKITLLWIVGVITFFLSSILDNLTSTVVMVTLLDKIMPKSEDRLIIGGGIVIAANAGGAWTPIGDVTTTMLWIGNDISSLATIKDLFLPSVVCMIVSFLCLGFLLKGEFTPKKENGHGSSMEPFGTLILALGIGTLVFTPIFKVLTGLPPVTGILLGLGVLWAVTDLLHQEIESRSHLKIPNVMSQIDLTSTFFFLGILLAVGALADAGLLKDLALWLGSVIPRIEVVAFVMGILSAIVDNVPLVAALMSMYSLDAYPVDSSLWQLVAYCAGTGGSILVIGSAAGVVYMGLEKVTFYWYAKRIALPAFVGYVAGFGVYLLMFG